MSWRLISTRFWELNSNPSTEFGSDAPLPRNAQQLVKMKKCVKNINLAQFQRQTWFYLEKLRHFYSVWCRHCLEILFRLKKDILLVILQVRQCFRRALSRRKKQKNYQSLSVLHILVFSRILNLMYSMQKFPKMNKNWVNKLVPTQIFSPSWKSSSAFSGVVLLPRYA